MWVQIAILVVSMVVNYATRPKPPSPKPQDMEAPVSDEGRGIRKIYGTVWIEDAQIIAFDKVGTERIRSKGGKK